MSNPLYCRDIETGEMHELDAVQDAPSKWALRTAASLGQHANIDSALNVAVISNLATYRQDKFRDDMFVATALVGAGTATYEVANGGVKMEVPAVAGAAAIRQSAQYHNYFAGSPQLFELTVASLAPQAGVIKRLGAFSTLSSVSPFDTNRDGLYLESADGVLTVKVDKGGVNIFSAAQSAWDDPLDGAGASGITLDATAFQALAIEYLYLGGTCARFGFLIGEKIIWFHTFHNTNELASTMILSPVQPVRYEIRSTGGAGAMYQVCARVGTKGASIANPTEVDYEPSAFVNANALGTVYALCGVSLTDPRGHVEIAEAYALAATNDKFRFTIRKNPAVAGTFTYIPVPGTTYAIALGDVAGNPSTNIVTGGTIISQHTVQQGAEQKIAAKNRLLHLGSSVAGVSDTLVLCIEPLSVNLDIYGGITVSELP